MRNHIILFISLTFLFGCNTRKEAEATAITNNGLDWIYQVDSLLMPYWMVDDALGKPAGNFPTYRLNNGKKLVADEFDFTVVPPYLKQFIIEQTDSLRRDFLRVKSRQVFGYGVAYHLTGNEEYLEMAKMGVDFLLKNGEYETGSPITFWKNGIGYPDILQRNSQDLAYSLTGLAFYYYLTRDENVLEPILKVKDYIFEQYYQLSTLSDKSKIFMWIKEDFEDQNSTSKALVAQLDQLNAYLLLITPLVPDHLQESYKNDLKDLCYLIKDNFYNKEFNLFWGNLNDKSLAEAQTDFGHSIKTFWMLYMTGKLLGDVRLTEFAETSALNLLQSAYIENTGSWGFKFADGTISINRTKIWWVYAELDQMCATLSLNDSSLYSRYLKNTYRYWEDSIIDHENKEVWTLLDENNEALDLGIKAFHFKNAYHSLEHALVGYLSTANYYGFKTTLYYAYSKKAKPAKNEILPYYFGGEISSVGESSFKSPILQDYQMSKVVFDKIY